VIQSRGQKEVPNPQFPFFFMKWDQLRIS
jgi:hypothetical protein